MPKRNDYKVFLIVVLALVVTFVLLRIFPSEPEINCYEEQVEGMTIQEVANLLDRSLVEVVWLPEGVNVVPQVATDRVTYSYQSSCFVRIDYMDVTSSFARRMVEINVGDMIPIPSTRIPPTCSWQFVLDEALTSQNTYCNADVDRGNDTLDIRINFSAEFLPEDAQRVINEMRIVDPSG